jgi:hypothetical protein
MFSVEEQPWSRTQQERSEKDDLLETSESYKTSYASDQDSRKESTI